MSSSQRVETLRCKSLRQIFRHAGQTPFQADPDLLISLLIDCIVEKTLPIDTLGGFLTALDCRRAWATYPLDKSRILGLARLFHDEEIAQSFTSLPKLPKIRQVLRDLRGRHGHETITPHQKKQFLHRLPKASLKHLL